MRDLYHEPGVELPCEFESLTLTHVQELSIAMAARLSADKAIDGHK